MTGVRAASDVDVAWAAGLFEGEGCIWPKKSSRRKDGSYPPPMTALEIKLTDLDVLERFCRIVGVGKIRGPYRTPKSTKDYWSWQVTKTDDTMRVVGMFIPYMGQRRLARTQEVCLADVRLWRYAG